MEELLAELDKIADAGFFFVALTTALAIPDMCAAVSSDDGTTNRTKYQAWFDEWVAPNYKVGADRTPSLTGECCYYYRCGMLHQGRSTHDKLGYSRVLFIEPGSQFFLHNNVMNDALCIDVSAFVHSITNAARRWIEAKQGDPVFEKNFPSLMRRHHGGLHPYIMGIDVIS